MANLFPSIDESAVMVRWAPLVLEPLQDESERVVVGIVAASESGEVGCWKTMNGRRLRTLFGDLALSLSSVIDASVASLQGFAVHARTMEGWRSPLGGVYLGKLSTDYVRTFAEIRDIALRSCSSLSSGDASGSADTASTQGNAWRRQVQHLIREMRPGLSNCVDAQVRLALREHPVTFTFYGSTLAANVVVLSPRGLTRSLHNARAHLWNLSLLADAPELMFRPERRELLAGVGEGSPASASTADAIEELIEEASRREVSVQRVASSEQAARYIIDRAA